MNSIKLVTSRLVDALPVPSRISIFASRIIMLALTLMVMMWFTTTSFVVASPQPALNDIAIQQAVTQQQLIAAAEKLASLRQEVDFQRAQMVEVRDAVSTIRGVGIGFCAFITALQLIQMLMQVKVVRNEKNNNH